MTSLRWAGVTLAIMGATVALWLAWPEPAEPAPSQARSLPSIQGEILYRDASEIARKGSGRVVILRIDGPVEFVPYHFSDLSEHGPMPAVAWARELNAPVVFNAGQFDENLNHLGWLKRDSQWLVPYRHGAWMGLLLSGPIGGGAWARVADLEDADADVHERYRHTIQSMMLVDHKGKLRVRESDKTACRTVVAEDERGRILILITEGAVTLADFARWLTREDLGIVRAMNLDGGIESQLAVATPELTVTYSGKFGTGTTLWTATPDELQYPLPAVVAVRPVPRVPKAETSMRP